MRGVYDAPADNSKTSPPSPQQLLAVQAAPLPLGQREVVAEVANSPQFLRELRFACIQFLVIDAAVALVPLVYAILFREQLAESPHTFVNVAALAMAFLAGLYRFLIDRSVHVADELVVKDRAVMLRRRNRWTTVPSSDVSAVFPAPDLLISPRFGLSPDDGLIVLRGSDGRILSPTYLVPGSDGLSGEMERQGFATFSTAAEGLQGSLRDGGLGERFRPQFNELSVFVVGLALVLVFVTTPSPGATLLDAFLAADVLAKVVWGLLLCSLAYQLFWISFRHVFVRGPKNRAEKVAMLSFAVSVNGFAGLAAGMRVLQHSQGILAIFPMLNMVSALALLSPILRMTGLSQVVGDIVDIANYAVADDDATPLQVVLATVVVLVAFWLCRYVFEFYWAITLSVCVAYASFANGLARHEPTWLRTGWPSIRKPRQ